jgi:hypothetical protein
MPRRYRNRGEVLRHKTVKSAERDKADDGITDRFHITFTDGTTLMIVGRPLGVTVIGVDSSV